LTTYPGFENEDKLTITEAYKSTTRHEILRAFLNESGLMDSSHQFDRGWAKNEEMVDWIAIQGPKIYKAWQEADAV